jgi:hypothetical protein
MIIAFLCGRDAPVYLKLCYIQLHEFLSHEVPCAQVADVIRVCLGSEQYLHYFKDIRVNDPPGMDATLRSALKREKLQWLCTHGVPLMLQHLRTAEEMQAQVQCFYAVLVFVMCQAWLHGVSRQALG